MYLTSIPYKFNRVLLPVEIIQTMIGYTQSIAHGQLGIGDIVLLLLGQLGLIEVGIDVLAEMEVDVLDFRLLFGVEPRDQEINRPHVLHN